MKHEKYDYSGYCGEDEHRYKGDAFAEAIMIAGGLVAWSAICITIGVWLGGCS